MQVKLEDILEAAGTTEGMSSSSGMLLSPLTGGGIVRVPGLALMYTDTVLGAPLLLPHLLQTWGAVHKNLVLLMVRRVNC